MILGFLIDEQTAAAIAAGVDAAQDARGVARYLAVSAIPVLSGPHAGALFLPFDDAALDQVMHRGMRLGDFPEFAQLVALLGGLESRVEIDKKDITPPITEI